MVTGRLSLKKQGNLAVGRGEDEGFSGPRSSYERGTFPGLKYTRSRLDSMEQLLAKDSIVPSSESVIRTPIGDVLFSIRLKQSNTTLFSFCQSQ